MVSAPPPPFTAKKLAQGHGPPSSEEKSHKQHALLLLLCIKSVAVDAFHLQANYKRWAGGFINTLTVLWKTQGMEQCYLVSDLNNVAIVYADFLLFPSLKADDVVNNDFHHCAAN